MSMFPTGLDSFTNPSGTQPMNQAPQTHSQMHTLEQKAIVALETYLQPAGLIYIPGLVADSGITDNAPLLNNLPAGWYWIPPVSAGGYYGASEIDLGQGVWLVGGGHHPSKGPGNFIPASGSIYGSNIGPAHSGTFTDCVVKTTGKGGGLVNIGVFGNYDTSFNSGGIPTTTAGGLVSAIVISSSSSTSGSGSQLANVFAWGGMSSVDLTGLTTGNAADCVLHDVQVNQLLNVQGIALGAGTWNSSTQQFALTGSVPAGVTVGMLITANSDDGLLPVGSYISAISGTTITVANRYSDTFPTYNGWTKLKVDPYWLVIPGVTMTGSSSTFTVPGGYTGALVATNQWDGWSIFSGDGSAGIPTIGAATLVARGGVNTGSHVVTMTNAAQRSVTATLDIVAARSVGIYNAADSMATGKLSIEGGTMDISSADFVANQLHLSGDNQTSRGCGVSRTNQGPTIAATVFDGASSFEFHMRRDNGYLHLGNVRLMNGNTSTYSIPNCSTNGTGVITLTSGTVPSGVAVGQVITGTNIPANTAIGSFTTNTITLGNGVVASGSGSGLTMSVGTATACHAFVDNGVDAHSLVGSSIVGIKVGNDGYRSTVRFTGNATPSLCSVDNIVTDASTLQAGSGTTYGGLYLGGSPGKAVDHWANGVLQSDIGVPSGLSVFEQIVAGSYTYTIPSGATWLRIVVVGGGGGGGGGYGSSTAGGGGAAGGAGAWNEAYVNATGGAGETLSVTVGAAGTGGTGGTNATGQTSGTNGGRTTVASGTFTLSASIVANGGSAGLAGAASGTTNGGDYGRGGSSQIAGGGAQTATNSGAAGIGSASTAVAGGGGTGSGAGGDAIGATGGGGSGGQGGNSSSATGWGAPGSPGTAFAGGASSGTGGAASQVAASAANAAAASVGAGGGGGGGGPQSAAAQAGNGGNGGPGGVYIYAIG